MSMCITSFSQIHKIDTDNYLVDKPLGIGPCGVKSEKVYFKNNNENYQIISENGYVFELNNDFTTESLGAAYLFWFPDYTAYFTLRTDKIDKTKPGDSIELHMETCKWFINGNLLDEGRCLVIFYPTEKKYKVYLDGKLSDFVYGRTQQLHHKNDYYVNMITFKSPTHNFLIQDVLTEECRFNDICFSSARIKR